MGIVGDFLFFVVGLGVDFDFCLGMVNFEMIYKCVILN